MSDEGLSEHQGVPSLRIARLALPASGFENFTFPRFRSIVLGQGMPGDPEGADAARLAVGAWLGESPIGLALLSRPFGDGERELISIMVSNSTRRAGVGRQLLARAEELAFESGTSKLRAFHSTRLLALQAYEALLSRAGWSLPVPHHHRLAGKARWALQAATDWAPFLTRLRCQGFSTSTWNEITAADRTEIAEVVARDLPDKDKGFDPRLYEERRDALSELSMLLRQKGRIIGWLLGSEGAVSGTLHYSNGYVLPALRGGGWLIAGLREVCERQSELRGPETISVFETAPENEAMRRFMERQLDRYEGWMDTRLRCGKMLSSSSVV